MNKLFEIIKITHKDGTDRTDGRYPIRIGRRCELYIFDIGFSASFVYIPRDGEDYHGLLRTSRVEKVEIFDDIHKITTMNSVYYLKELLDDKN
jgi:hypothetical protein